MPDSLQRAQSHPARQGGDHHRRGHRYGPVHGTGVRESRGGYRGRQPDGGEPRAGGGGRALGRRALAIRTDVSLKTDVDRMVAGTMEAFGQVDVLVNSAGLGSGIGEDGRGLGHRDPPWLIDIPEDNWDPIIAVNLKGVYLCCAAAGRIMAAQRRGDIINISSRAGAAGAARPYSAAKAGVNRLTAGLAREFGPYNVRVNALAPTYTRTEVGVMQRPSEVAAYDAPETLARYPLGRIAEPIGHRLRGPVPGLRCGQRDHGSDPQRRLRRIGLARIIQERVHHVGPPLTLSLSPEGRRGKGDPIDPLSLRRGKGRG